MRISILDCGSQGQNGIDIKDDSMKNEVSRGMNKYVEELPEENANFYSLRLN